MLKLICNGTITKGTDMAKKKSVKMEFCCDKCNRIWFIENPKGIVKCGICNTVAIRIIRASTNWKRTPRGRDSNHGGDSFDPSPSHENIARLYEDER